VHVAEVADAPLEDHLVLDTGLAGIDVDVEVLGIREVDLDSRLFGGGDYGLLFPADGVIEEGERNRRLFAPVFLFELRRSQGEESAALSDELVGCTAVLAGQNLALNRV